MSTENTIRRQTTGLMYARKEEENWSSTDEMLPRLGRLRGFFDGSFEDSGRSGCGIVIHGVDRQKKCDNQLNRSASRSGCCHSGGSCWSMRAHGYP